ncbi:MAG: hypothetical protein QM756_41550 [Polyangiaceae bacterium]
MAYAITCRSCGARFSVANDLVEKRSGSELALRCKRCGEPIRVTASHPPQAMPNHPSPPSPPARPRPPLKKAAPAEPATPKPAPAKVPRKAPPPRRERGAQTSMVALAPGLLPKRGEVTHDLFDAPPPSDRSGAVDLSDAAHSEPPAKLQSSAPPLFNLTHDDAAKHPVAHEDVDFLLGLRGSPGTSAALQSPSLTDLLKKAESEPPPELEPETLRKRPAATETPAAVTIAKPEPRTAPSAAPPARRRSKLPLALGLAALGISGAVLATGKLSQPRAPEQAAVAIPAVVVSDAPAVAAAAPVVESTPSEPEAAAPSALSTSRAAPRNTAKVTHNEPPTAAEPKPEPAVAKPSVAEPALPKPVSRPEPREPVGAGFDCNSAVSALATQAGQASKCRKDGDPSGTANITITFAPSGRVTSANLSGPPFAGTATGGCIAAAMRRARVPAFDGDSVTVSKTVVIQ